MVPSEQLCGSAVPQLVAPDASLRRGQGRGVQPGPPPDLLLGSTALPEASHTSGDASVLEKAQGRRASPGAHARTDPHGTAGRVPAGPQGGSQRDTVTK